MTIDLDKLERLHASATPGPWRFLWHRDGDAHLLTTLYADSGSSEVHLTVADGRWITAARDATPALIAELREARATIGRVREAADKYAGARWRDTETLSVEYAEGLNQAGDEILDILDGARD